jgi:AbrB family looped-hinge helix DNA binding protein
LTKNRINDSDLCNKPHLYDLILGVRISESLNFKIFEKITMSTVAQNVSSAKPELIRVKERFQVTIPAAVRRQMKIAEGDFVEMRFVDGEIRIKPRRAEVQVEMSGAQWYKDYLASLPLNPLAEALTDQEIHRMVKELR